MTIKRLSWFLLIIVLAIIIGLYPAIYYMFDMHNKGLLQTKPAALFKNEVWHLLFYTHITFGAFAMLFGWPQFVANFRNRNLRAHRFIGKIYLLSVLLSGVAGLYIAYYASGGLISQIGFGFLAVAWLFTGLNAYRSILKLDIIAHQNWMVRNYSLTFAAVTLRIWLPLLQFAFHFDFFFAYPIVAWLCWIPNLLVAELLIYRLNLNRAFSFRD